MAGGWGKQGNGVPLSERVQAGPGHAPGPLAGAPTADEVCPARHCWVGDAIDGRGVKRPGLLVEWRQPAGPGAGWEGRVVYAAQLRADGWVLVEEWLPAALLTPL